MKEYYGMSKKNWEEVWCKAYETVNRTVLESEKYFEHNGEKYMITDHRGYAYQIWKMVDGEWAEIGAPVAYNPV